ncbi:MAG: ThiF family adenylyltransferase [Acidobacteria bacterium]|nr:ThiF family adenylyltransferase [Acidobacteriota bacterium]
MGQISRLLWLTRRAIRWLELAASDGLRQNGDPFELPALPTNASPLVAFDESSQSFAQWNEAGATSGYCRFEQAPSKSKVLVVSAFENERHEVIAHFSWGSWLEDRGKEVADGIWIRLSRPLYQQPWEIPGSWKDLSVACADQGVSLLEVLRKLVGRLRDHGNSKQGWAQRLLLLGFPVPREIGGTAERLHWLAVHLPRLAAGDDFSNGFRKNEMGYWATDRRNLSGSKRVRWLETACWSGEELEGRGRSSMELRSASVVIIGAGALGSCLAELLVRQGNRSLLIIDQEKLEAGNLVRHVLTLEDIGIAKAPALADHLNTVSPHCRIHGVESSLVSLSEEERSALSSAEVVIDCTGSDSVLRFLSELRGDKEHLMFSLSLGAYGRRIYCFFARGLTFPWDEFASAIRSWLQSPSEVVAPGDLHRGLGCWHPALPVRLDAVWMAAVVGLRCLETDLQKPSAYPHLSVFDQTPDSDGFPFLRRLAGPEGAGDG